MKLNRDLLAKAAGIDGLGEHKSERLEAFADLLLAANSKINLISRSVDPFVEIESQIAISLMLHRLVPCDASKWIDIGSGGGFPVIPLACVCDEVQFTAVEQIAKKAFFVERAAQELDLKNVHVEANSIERVIREISEPSWNVVTIKAVTELDESLRWAHDLLIAGGELATYKPNRPSSYELQMAEKHGFEFTKSLDVKELIDTIDLQIVMYKKS